MSPQASWCPRHWLKTHWDVMGSHHHSFSSVGKGTTLTFKQAVISTQAHTLTCFIRTGVELWTSPVGTVEWGWRHSKFRELRMAKRHVSMLCLRSLVDGVKVSHSLSQTQFVIPDSRLITLHEGMSLWGEQSCACEAAWLLRLVDTAAKVSLYFSSNQLSLLSPYEP